MAVCYKSGNREPTAQNPPQGLAQVRHLPRVRANRPEFREKLKIRESSATELGPVRAVGGSE